MPAPRAEDVELMLCEGASAAFTRPGWLWELKYDGFRVLAEKKAGKARLVLRRGTEATRQFPEAIAALERLAVQDALFDGELVTQDPYGKPMFEWLLDRHGLTRPMDIAAAAAERPAVLFLFDLLAEGESDLRQRTLLHRKQRLAALVPREATGVRCVDTVPEQGEALLEQVRAMNLEGVVGKRADSRYLGGRGGAWVKVAITQTVDLAVVGHAPDFGALFLAAFQDGQFVFAGKAGSGFGPKQQALHKAALASLHRETPPCVGVLPPRKEVVWIEPKLTVTIRCKLWRPGMQPREPVFLHVRPDKAPTECTPPHRLETGPVAPKAPPLPAPTQPEVALTNPTKLYWPEDGITKKELVDYYVAVAPWLLPYLKDRPLMLTRYPDGIHGKNFFQKAAPKSAPGWLKTVRLRNEEEQKDIDQILCGDVRTLAYVANLGAIPLHIPSLRVPHLERADWCVIDLDPKTAPFTHVVQLARTMKELCDACGMPVFVKTTGSSGLHLLMPLGQQLEHPGAVQLAELFGTLLERRHPAIATTERMLKKREGKVYLDCYQNGSFKLIAAPFCVRPLPTAPVSMTLSWDEVTPALSPRAFTLRDAVARLTQTGDPMAPVLTLKPDLPKVLGALAQLAHAG